jgi:hypothetical protein
MTAPDRSYDPIRFHRGTRGFAAFVTGLTGFIVLGAATVVVPSLGLDRMASTWAVLIGLVAGVAHLVGAVGLVRGRRWGASMVGYLATAGAATAGFGALLAAVGIELFGADRATAFGFFAWLIGSWVVAARFAFKPFTFTPHARRAAVAVARPAPDARPVTGARKRTALRPAVASQPVATPA